MSPLMIAPSFALAFMATCYALYQPLWERAFMSDDSPVAWLSSALLLANGAIAWRLSGERVIGSRLGATMALGLLCCALDEQFMLHERLKYQYLPAWFPADAGLQERLSELPLALVGLGGALCVGLFVRQRWRFDRAACSLTLAALAVGIFAMAVDFQGQEWAIAPLEEGIEVLAESLFLAGLLAAGQVQSSSWS